MASELARLAAQTRAAVYQAQQQHATRLAEPKTN
jgi:hypothetical protein